MCVCHHLRSLQRCLLVWGGCPSDPGVAIRLSLSRSLYFAPCPWEPLSLTLKARKVNIGCIRESCLRGLHVSYWHSLGPKSPDQWVWGGVRSVILVELSLFPSFLTLVRQTALRRTLNLIIISEWWRPLCSWGPSVQPSAELHLNMWTSVNNTNYLKDDLSQQKVPRAEVCVIAEILYQYSVLILFSNEL